MVHPYSERRSRWQAASAVVLVAALAGCGSAPPRSAGERDGPQARPPPDLARVPDAEPRIEPIRSGGPNKPYEAFGRAYVPITDDRPFSERGLASWYGKKFHGRRTASGETYDMYAMTAAHPTLPIPSYVRVVNPANRREVVVRVNDRGPFHGGRIIDLSYTAASRLGLLKGVAPVELTRITFDDIRTGAWRRDASPQPAPVDPAQADMAQAPPAPSAPLLAESPAGPSTAAATAAVAVAQAPSALAAAADDSAPSPAARPARGFWVQLGAFRQREGADGFQRRVVADLDWLGPLLGVFSEPSGYRLQAGPYASRDEAQGVARRVREALNLVPVVVERK